MSTNDDFQGVSSCYVFKSQLQEYAQKVGLPTPVYETIKEGPSHEPSFRSTVIVNDVRYDSMPGFFNRKAAEQSAAEVALMELAKSANNNEHISQPVHKKGLCKNLLQQYAQKMNYAIPSYECRKDEAPGRAPLFSCTVDVGGIKYIGAAAVTKKEAEIKAARTALLAIQSSPGSAEKPAGNSMYSVIPCKKKSTDLGNNTQESKTAALKPRKGCFKKKPRKNKRAGNTVNNAQGENMGSLEYDLDNQTGHDLGRTDDGIIEVMESGGFPVEQTERFQSERSFIGNMESSLLHCSNGDSENVHLLTPNIQPVDLRIPNDSLTPGDDSTVLEDLNKISYVGIVAPMVNDSPLCQGEIASDLDWQLAPILNDYTFCQGELTSD